MFPAERSAAVPMIFGATHSGPDGLSTLHSIDATTGAATPIGAGIGFERVGAMDFHPGTGVLYATGERADGSDTAVLLTIDTVSGAGTEVAALNGGSTHSFGTAYADISFRNGDSTLYAYLEGGDGLGIIDITTGALIELGGTGVSCCGNGMAFSAADILHHSNEDNLHTLDQATGSATFVAPMGFSPPADDFPRINGMDFDAASGTLYAALNDGEAGTPENYLAVLDPTTGVTTIIGATADGMDALAVRAVAVSEPGALVLLAAGLVAVARTRRRSR